jgi:phosphotransacetylase
LFNNSCACSSVALPFDISNIELINPATSELKAELVQSFVERRKGKATEEQGIVPK